MNFDKEMGTINAKMLADHILSKYGPMSHLKLQKLVYYCEAYHLAYFGESLIPENFEAWMHGPVCRELYNQLKGESILYSDVSFSGSHNPEEIFKRILAISQMELINDVLDEMSTWTNLELESATHKDAPWREARRGFSPADKCTVVISKNTMKSFYRNEINAPQAPKA